MILAIETATSACSAAVLAADGALVAHRLEDKGPAHTRRLLPFVHEVFEEAAVGLRDLDTIVCGLGPGAYTGIRIGVATARALAQAAGLRLGGVPTLAAVALALAEGERRARSSPPRRSSPSSTASATRSSRRCSAPRPSPVTAVPAGRRPSNSSALSPWWPPTTSARSSAGGRAPDATRWQDGRGSGASGGET